MYASTLYTNDYTLKPGYSYSGKIIGFVLGEVNLFFMLFPFSDFWVTFGKWIDLTSVTNMFNTVFALISLVYLFFAARFIKISWARTVTMIAMALLLLISLLWVHPAMIADAKSSTIRTILTIFQTLVIVKIFSEKGDEYVFDVLKRFAIIIGILSALSIALFPAESSWTIDDTGRKQSFFSSPNNLGQFLSFFFLFLNFYKRSSLSWPTVIFLNAVIIYQVMGCDSKTSLTGGLLCFILYYLRFLIRPFLVFVICAGMYLPYYTQQFAPGEAEKIEFAKRDMSFTGRSDVWHIMIDNLNDQGRSIIGFGSGGYWGEKTYHPKSSMHELDWEPHQGHNGYLDMKVNNGWIGVVLLIIFLFHYFTNIFRVMNNKNIVMLFMSVIFVINNITETSFFRGKHFFFVLLMLFFWYTVFKKKKDVEEEEEETQPVEETIKPRPVFAFIKRR